MARPPSTEAHEAVLTTALKLMTDHGIEGTSVDEIAQVSGVSKATIYKHWESKDVLCIEAISRLKCDLPVFDSGNPRADVTGLLQHLAHTKKPEAFSRVWPRVIGYAASNPAFAKAFRARIVDGPRVQLAAIAAKRHRQRRASRRSGYRDSARRAPRTDLVSPVHADDGPAGTAPARCRFLLAVERSGVLA